MRKILLKTLAAFFLSAAFCLSARADVVINEVLLCTATYTGGHAYEWVELVNNGTSPAELQGMTLTYTRKGETQSYTISDSVTLKPGKFAVIYCTGGDEQTSSGTTLYSTIDVSSKGGTVSLYTADNALAGTVTLGRQYCDVSYGLVDGTETYRYLEEPTRGAKNGSVGYEQRCSAPILIGGGFYDECPPVYVMAGADEEIRYTTDGSEPTRESALWVNGVTFGRGVTALRIRAFAEGKLPSETVTQSFFIGISYEIPIVSLITDNAYTFNRNTGILVKGFGSVPNYSKNWEYPVNVEYYNTEHTQELNQMATFRVTGATSRMYGQKAISLFARGALGSSSFDFNPFQNREGYTSFKCFTLRAGGSECYKTRFKDALLTGLAEGEGIMYQESCPCLVYINGKFYGLANLREKVNKYSLAAWEGVTDEEAIDNVTIIKGRTGVQNGTLDEWQSLISFIKTHSLADEENLQYVLDRMDVENYFTMVAFQMITGNADTGNQRLYKFEGGKFKWVLYDLDAAMTDTNRSPIGLFFESVKKTGKRFYHEPFSALMKNEKMQDLFLTITGSLLARKFNPQNMEDKIAGWVEALEDYMPMQIKRWPAFSPKSVSSWKYEAEAFRKIAVTRPRAVMKYLISTFKLTDEEQELYFGEFKATLSK